MKRYLFTGHLSPKPPGTERAMCQLSGEVYLAMEVDAEFRELARVQAIEVQRLQARAAALGRRVIELKSKLREMRREAKQVSAS